MRTFGILKQIQSSVDGGEVKKEGNITFSKIDQYYTVKKGKELIHEGVNFRIAYDYFLKLVISR
ncbi:MAG TPA: hypothetical protein PK079_04285 [Leptospiraceae bacterium]|nr:hypothetical protein [Leptospiraceae bacterium]HMW05456.1 hypothetical protein [Leptospiraceae bacterium]HMX31395.1 hypothetical protein [Leptospiraceae bacterium]HMY30966.1 hypothetical protein [Leptospiraceae bacterium]HMZ63377.1 hypothetical protein [Leptospiraceae bacterium]